MMPQPAAPVALAPDLHPSGLEVRELHWERIQLVVRLRPAPGSAPDLDAGHVLLRRLDGRGQPLASRPALGEHPPGERSVRFNVFTAHDQMPLDPGAWQLVMHRPGQTPQLTAIPMAPTPGGLSHAVRDFVSGSLLFRVGLVKTEPGLPMTVDISTWRRSETRLARWSPRRLAAAINRWRRWAWIRIFHLLLEAMRRLPRRGPMIVFTSDSREELGGNLRLVHDRLVERGLDRRLRLRSIFKPSVRARRRFRDRSRLVWLLARADIILLEDYQPAVHRLPSRPDQRIIQLWHAWGAFKTVGYSRMGKPGGPNPYSRVHKNYTFATVSSTHEVPFYAEAFGLPEERIVPTGTPRMDEFLDASNQAEGRRRAHAAIPATRDREVILFAPTFRGKGARQADYPVEILDVHALHAVCAERDAMAVIKMHPFVPRRVDIPVALRDRIFDASDLPVETNDLLLISDLLVTDYSSLVFEYAALGRPMLFFAYDLEEYVATRDFYEPFESFVPGRIVRTFDELVDAVRRREYEADKVEPFARRHLPDEPGSATDRIIDELILTR